MRVFALGLLVSAAQALAFMHPTSALFGMLKCCVYLRFLLLVCALDERFVKVGINFHTHETARKLRTEHNGY